MDCSSHGTNNMASHSSQVMMMLSIVRVIASPPMWYATHGTQAESGVCRVATSAIPIATLNGMY